MSQIQPTQSLLPAVRTNRALSRISNETAVAASLVQAKAELEAAKVDGVAAIAGKAMQGVALLSQMEQSLAQAVPHASGRLATIADIAAMSMAGIVADAARRIGR